ncbi:hypothetical protein U1Q18_020720 [Sarracenia purpurea var. burkii]
MSMAVSGVGVNVEAAAAAVIPILFLLSLLPSSISRFSTPSAVVVGLPILGKTIPALRPEKDVFFVVKAFAAGVILATGFIHVLPDAFSNLTLPCLSDEAWQFPFKEHVLLRAKGWDRLPEDWKTRDDCTGYQDRRNDHQFELERLGLVAMFAVAVGEENGDQGGSSLHVHTRATHGRAHGSTASLSSQLSGDSADHIRHHRVISQVSELGIVVHFVIIEISLGLWKVRRPLDLLWLH